MIPAKQWILTLINLGIDLEKATAFADEGQADKQVYNKQKTATCDRIQPVDGN